MTPFKQLHRHDPAAGVFGDCYRTAIGCLLDLPPAEVPHFVEGADTNDGQAQAKAQAWLRTRGLVLVTVAYQGSADVDAVLSAIAGFNPGLCFLFSGRSKNGTNHIVVACDGVIVHDPAIDDSGIVGPMDNGFYYVEFVAPAAMLRAAL